MDLDEELCKHYYSARHQKRNRLNILDYLPLFTKRGGRPSTSKSGGCVLKSTRYDRVDHFAQAVPLKKRKWCAGETYNSVGQTMCCKCKVGLCINCFKTCHTEQ